MVNIDLLLKEYDAEVHVKPAKSIQKGTPEVEADNRETFTVWPEDFLPSTKYTKDPSQYSSEKMEKIAKKNPSVIKTEKLVDMLTSIDIILIKDLTADDLISYTGELTSVAISHIVHVNKALNKWLSTELDSKRLFSMLKYSISRKNYNLLNIVIKSLQIKKLSDSKLKKVVYYKNLLDNQDEGIFPFDWMLKDCEESNLNVSSEVASLRFCRIIEKLKQMKGIEPEYVIKEKHKQLIFSKLWMMTSKSITQAQQKISIDTNLYLLL